MDSYHTLQATEILAEVDQNCLMLYSWVQIGNVFSFTTMRQ